MNSYLILNRNYQWADYLLSVRDVKQRQSLTKYRLSDRQTQKDLAAEGTQNVWSLPGREG